jgi:hypothetical protein
MLLDNENRVRSKTDNRLLMSMQGKAIQFYRCCGKFARLEGKTIMHHVKQIVSGEGKKNYHKMEKDNHHQINILRQIKKTCVAFHIAMPIKAETMKRKVTCVRMDFMTFHCNSQKSIKHGKFSTSMWREIYCLYFC